MVFKATSDLPNPLPITFEKTNIQNPELAKVQINSSFPSVHNNSIAG